MGLLFQLTDKDIGMPFKEVKDYKTRIAARGIIINEDGKIAIQKKTNTKEYKLIGGGIENGEKPSDGFKREVFEETGCKINIIHEIGIVEEYISMKSIKQISYIFVAKVLNDTSKLNLTEKEKAEGAELIWVSLFDALKLMENSYHELTSSTYEVDYDVYRMKFISLRDRKILKYYIDNYE